MEKEKDNKKVFATVIALLLLLVAVVGVSFAMYSFSAAGTKENVIQTGSVSITFNNVSSINLTNEYPVTDAKGVTLENGVMEFDVRGELNGSMKVDYDLTITEITPGATLTAEYVKFNLTQKLGDAAATYVLGSETTGVALSGYSNGTTPIATASYESTSALTRVDHYVLRAWVSDTYDLPNQTVSGKCVGTDGNVIADQTTSETCTGKWVQSNQTNSETITFKVKVDANQETNS